MFFDGRAYCSRCFPLVVLNAAHERLGTVLQRVTAGAELAYDEAIALDVREVIAIAGMFWSAELLEAADTVRREMER